MSTAVTTALPSPSELAVHARPGPRYTSYPPATQFRGDVTEEQVQRRLAALAEEPLDVPISLYVHVPFCSRLCWYCGCNVVITRDRERGGRYVDVLCDEIALLAGAVGGRRAVSELSLGGGSPNFLRVEDMQELLAAIGRHFDILPDADLGIELDPRDTSAALVAALAGLGFRRLSVGVQDFDPAVQELIHRHQSREQTVALIEEARARGFQRVNIDLIYGLPAQTEESIGQTVDAVLEMKPEQVALFGYAHLPDRLPHQKLVERGGALPGVQDRATLLLVAIERFERAGYVRIGIDHFARPGSALAQAAATGRLHRNFQGYVVERARNLLACGATGISDAGGAYWQNHGDLEAWATAVRAGKLPVARGIVLDRDDLIRRHVITRLMCDGELRYADVDARFDIRFEDYFARELQRLAGDELAPLAVPSPGDRRIELTPLGRNLARNVCMVFDRYLDPTARASPTI